MNATLRKATLVLAPALVLVLCVLTAPAAFAGDTPFEKYEKHMRNYQKHLRNYHEHVREAQEELRDGDWDDYREEMAKAQKDMGKAQKDLAKAQEAQGRMRYYATPSLPTYLPQPQVVYRPQPVAVPRPVIVQRPAPRVIVRRDPQPLQMLLRGLIGSLTNDRHRTEVKVVYRDRDRDVRFNGRGGAGRHR